MNATAYQAAIADYTAALEGLFAPAVGATRGAALAGPSATELAQRAEELDSLTAQLTRQAAGFLGSEDPAVRVGAERHLLAQAAASLRVADRLLAAAAAAGETAAPEATRGPVGQPAEFDALVALLETPLAEAGSSAPPATRTVRATTTPDDLVAVAESALNQVLGDVVSFGEDTLAGLLGLDTALLKQAASMISQELGQLVEQLSSQVSRLVARAIGFLVRAYDALLSALGEDVASDLRQQAADWLNRLQQGEALADLLGYLFQVDLVRQQVVQLITGRDVPDLVLDQTGQAVAALPDSFRSRTALARQILAAIGLIKRFPATRVPLAELATAVLYLSLFGFALYVGADYVDAPRLERLGRVPGVLHTAEAGLAAG